MSNEMLFTVVVTVIVVVVLATVLLSKYRARVGRWIDSALPSLLARFRRISLTGREKNHETAPRSAAGQAVAATEEERSRLEWERLQKLIEERKQVARDTDISYHLWHLYREHFRGDEHGVLQPTLQDGRWYDVKIHKSHASNGLRQYEFELKGVRYRFVDDEERQGWADNVKFFSLYLYDEENRCLIEVPMKVRIDKWGSHYSILSGGPKAFVPGDWIKDFINVKLKNQYVRNQEIRMQQHQERLQEIEELKRRFGIAD